MMLKVWQRIPDKPINLCVLFRGVCVKASTDLPLKKTPARKHAEREDSYLFKTSENQENKAILRDTFGRQHTYLRISLTERCNLRCQYCMPEEGVTLSPANHILSSDEIIRLATLFSSSGVTKIRLTGGEPLVRKDIVDLCGRLGKLPGIKQLAITTNGLLLPRLLPGLKEAGVTHFNISLDTFQAHKFQLITRRKGWDRVMQSISDCISLGYYPKVNCVVRKGINDDEIIDFVAMSIEKPLEVRFIEYMPFDGNKWNYKSMVSYQDMLSIIKEKYPSITPLPVAVHDTAMLYTIPGGKGKVGFIASMTNQFCGGCNRLRLTADGNLKVCLFGAAEVSLRDMMRRGENDEYLCTVIGQAVQRKKAQHAGMHDLAATKNRPMVFIGG